MLEALNLLPVPEIAAYHATEYAGVHLVAYAIREPGSALWGAYAALRTQETMLSSVTLSEAYNDPQHAVAVAYLELQEAPSQPRALLPSLRIIEGGKA